jgi:hypothetical protein
VEEECLIAMEDRLRVEDIVYLRALADAEVEREEAMVHESVQEQR